MLFTTTKEELTSKLKLALSFYKYSQIYHYANYMELKVVGDELCLTQSLILGKAINTGILRVKVNGSGSGDGSAMLPSEELKKHLSLIPEDVVISLENNKVVFTGSNVLFSIPTVDTEVQPLLLHEYQEALKGNSYPFDFSKVYGILKILKKDVTTNPTDFRLMAYYVGEEDSYSTNGIRMTKVHDGSNIPSIVFPQVMYDVFKELDKTFKDYDYEIYKNTVESIGVESYQKKVCVLRNTDVDVSFQEWDFNNGYPIDIIRGRFQGTPDFETTDMSILQHIIDIGKVSTIIAVDFMNGKISGVRSGAEIYIEKQNLPIFYLNNATLPSAKDVEEYHTIKVVENTMLILEGNDKSISLALMEAN